MAVTNICNSCHWWEKSRIAHRGRCHRFPTTLETVASDWCGEHKQIAEAEIILEPNYEAMGLHEEPKKKTERSRKNV